MITTLPSRLLLMIFGLLYPAYECFKTVENPKPEKEKLVFWCHYWILAAIFFAFERIADVFMSWIPLYGVAKFAFFIYLWHPRTRAATHVYKALVKPYIAKHEKEIDSKLLELKKRAGTMATLLWKKGSSYGRSKFAEVIMQNVISNHHDEPAPAQEVEFGRGRGRSR